MEAQPYLDYDGRCEEALEFYRKAIDAEVTMLMRYRENPEPMPGMVPPNADDKVMHSSFTVGGTTVMAADGYCKGKPEFKGVSLTLTVPTDAEADRRFAALAEGGKVQMPLTRTFFASNFGMLTDKFGLGWMVMVAS